MTFAGVDSREMKSERSEQKVTLRERLLEQVRPAVETVRRELFGDSSAPFASHEEAASWLETAHAEGAEKRERVREAAAEVALQLQNRVRDLNHFVEHDEWPPEGDGGQKQRDYDRALWEFNVRPLRVRFRRPDEGSVAKLDVLPGSKLGRLARHVERLSEATGLREWQVTSHVLTGSEPSLPPVRIDSNPSSPVRLPGKVSLTRKRVLMEVNTPDLTTREWRKVLKEVEDCWDDPWRTGLDEIDWAIFEVVHDLGGLPSETENPWGREFWEQVLVECNDRGIEHSRGGTFTSWRGPMMRVRKALEEKDEALVRRLIGREEAS